MLEIPSVQQAPIDFTQVVQIGIVVRHCGIRMLIGKHERNMKLRYSDQRRDDDQNLFIRNLTYVISRVDVEHHDRKRREIEGHIIAQSTSWANSDSSMISLSDQIDIADVAIIGI